MWEKEGANEKRRDKGFAFVLLNEGERREFDISTSSSASYDDIECRLSVRLSICLPSCPSSLFFPSIAERDELYVVGKAASQSWMKNKKLVEFAKGSARERRGIIRRRPFYQLY